MCFFRIGWRPRAGLEIFDVKEVLSSKDEIASPTNTMNHKCLNLALFCLLG